MKGTPEAMRRVWENRWFSGFATAVVLLGAFAAAGLTFGGVGETTAEPVHAAGQIRVKLPWLPEAGRGEWIEIESFQWVIQGSSTRPSSGPPTVSDIVITKPVDDASPKLHLALARGEHLEAVVIQLCTQDCDKPTKAVEVVLKDVVVSGYSIGSSPSADKAPTESVTFNYAKAEVTYFAQDKKNEPTATLKWDCSAWPSCVPY